MLWVIFFQEATYKQEEKERLINRTENQKEFYFFEEVFLLPWILLLLFIWIDILFCFACMKKNNFNTFITWIRPRLVSRLLIQKRKARFLNGRSRTQEIATLSNHLNGYYKFSRKLSNVLQFWGWEGEEGRQRLLKEGVGIFMLLAQSGMREENIYSVTSMSLIFRFTRI